MKELNEIVLGKRVIFLKYALTSNDLNLKLIVSAIFYQIFIFSPNDSLSKTMKNVFYFI